VVAGVRAPSTSASVAAKQHWCGPLGRPPAHTTVETRPRRSRGTLSSWVPGAAGAAELAPLLNKQLLLSPGIDLRESSRWARGARHPSIRAGRRARAAGEFFASGRHGVLLLCSAGGPPPDDLKSRPSAGTCASKPQYKLRRPAPANGREKLSGRAGDPSFRASAFSFRPISPPPPHQRRALSCVGYRRAGPPVLLRRRPPTVWWACVLPNSQRGARWWIPPLKILAGSWRPPEVTGVPAPGARLQSRYAPLWPRWEKWTAARMRWRHCTIWDDRNHPHSPSRLLQQHKDRRQCFIETHCSSNHTACSAVCAARRRSASLPSGVRRH